MDHNSDWSNFFKYTAVLKSATPILFYCLYVYTQPLLGGKCSVWWLDGDENPGVEVWSLHALTTDTVQNQNMVWNAPSEFKTCNPHWAELGSWVCLGLTCKASYSVVTRGYFTSHTHVLGLLRLLWLWIFSALLLTCVKAIPVSQPPQHSPATSEAVKRSC